VQDVCWDQRIHIRKQSQFRELTEVGAWVSKSGVGISSLKMCRDRPARSWISWQTLHCAPVRAGLQKGNLELILI
jgi:hypothetical protein